MLSWALALFAALMAVSEPPPPPAPMATWGDWVMPLVLLGLLRARPRLDGVAWAGLGYLAWALLSAWVHRAGAWKLLGLVELWLVMVAASTVAADAGARDRVLRGWILGAAAMCAIGLGASALGVPTGGELAWQSRPRGLTRSINMLAQLSLTPLLVLVADGERLFGRRARAALLALVGVTMLLTLSRTLLAAGFGLVTLKSRRLAVPAAAVTLVLAVASMRVEVHGASEPGIRWRIAASAWRTAVENPLFGVGPAARPAEAGWPRASDPAESWDAHSTPLDLAATLGFPALLLFGALIILVLRKSTEGVLRIALYATLLDAITIDVEDFRHVWLLLGLVMAETRARRAATPPASTAPATN